MVPEATSIAANGPDVHGSSSAKSSLASPLTSEMLTRFESRAATYDRENRLLRSGFSEDFRVAGYFRLPVPVELGGAGFTLAQMPANSSAWPITRRLQLWP